MKPARPDRHLRMGCVERNTLIESTRLLRRVSVMVMIAGALLISLCMPARPTLSALRSLQGTSGPFFGSGAGPFVFDGDLRALPRAEGVKSGATAGAGLNDTATRGTASMPALVQNFAGLSNGGDPPDANGDVGSNHYIQAINSVFAIYNKTGTMLSGPTSLNVLFAASPATGTPCDNDYVTDPIVLYDVLADRWVLAAGAYRRDGIAPVPPFYECIAVSKTPDPVSGGWYKYAMRTGADLPVDLLNHTAKLAVWPNGYYMSANLFRAGAGGGFDHVRVWAIDRVSILEGDPLREVHFDVPDPSYFGLLPSNLHGASPPAGRPNIFLSVDPFPNFTSNQLHLWRFHVDFNTPANSWFGQSATVSTPTNLIVNSYTIPASGFGVSQPYTQDTLDPQANRLMFALQYRNINGVESLWANHTVLYGSQLAVRWYEIRNPNVSPAVVQQGNLINATGSGSSGDTYHRWMGSLAVDRFGNMAIGYNISKANPYGVYPGIRYAGRLSTDPANALTQGETVLYNGTGSHIHCQVEPCISPWGRYSAMTIDPTDDCTFWYTGEYGDGTSGYGTRISSFRFPACASFSLVVDRADDVDDRRCTISAGDCSLRGAINLLNGGGFAGAKITFHSSITKINLVASLPTIIASHNAILGINGVPRIDGILAGAGTVAFPINATEFTLAGLSVVNVDPASGYDVRLLGGTRNVIRDNYLGTLPAGVSVTGCTLDMSAPGGAVTRNAWAGIQVDAGVTHRDGTGRAAAYVYNNTIGCHTRGIRLWGADGVSIGRDAAGRVVGNRVGVNGAAGVALFNGEGVSVLANAADGADGNDIWGNTVAYSGGDGIHLSGSASGALSGACGATTANTIAGNRIYVNGGDGIRLDGNACANVIGGSSDAERNLIYGNLGNGIGLLNSANNGVLGNTIGSVAGGGASANHGSGVWIGGGGWNWVGGYQVGSSRVAKGNLIGGNSGHGVALTSGAHDNLVSGNAIGASTAPNSLSGVAITSGAHDNTLDMPNSIAYNTQYGVLLDGTGTQNNLIRGAAISRNGLDGIGERNGAGANRWTMLSTSYNGGMGIDKDAASDGANIPTPVFPVITSVARAGSVVMVSGKAQPTRSPLSAIVEVYAVAVNALGFGEGIRYQGAAGTDGNGNWSLAVQNAGGMCYVAFETITSAGVSYSTEFGLNSCRYWMPVMRKGS